LRHRSCRRRAALVAGGQDGSAELEGARGLGGDPLRVYLSLAAPLPASVVLGFLLPRDRLAALRPLTGPRGAPHAPARRAPGRLHSSHRLLAQPPRLAARTVLRDQLLPRHPYDC